MHIPHRNRPQKINWLYNGFSDHQQQNHRVVLKLNITKEKKIIFEYALPVLNILKNFFYF